MQSRIRLFASLIFLAVNLNVLGQSTPIVAELTAADVPMQQGLSAVLENDPTGKADYPAVVYRGLVFVAYSHVDNRLGMTIIGYDKSEKPRVQIRKEGARYLREIQVDSRRQLIRFVGQNDREIVVPWKRLIPVTTMHVGLHKKGKHVSPHAANGASPAALEIASEFSQPKDFATALRDLEKMQREWEVMEQEMQEASDDAADSVRKERAAIMKELKQPTISYETATRLSAMSALLDVTIMGQMLGDVFSGGGMTEQEVQREMMINTKLIQKIRSKVAGEGFTGTPATQKNLLGRIDKMLVERKKAAASSVKK